MGLDVLCIGEALVDFLPDRRGRLRDLDRFDVHSGGAPANVAIGLARQGLQVGFAGVVGEDEFGHLLSRKLSAEGVATHLRFSAEARTGLWFVALDESGNRSFFNPIGVRGADKLIAATDVPAALVASARWLHCGSSAHVLPAAQAALRAAIDRARAAGVAISFDPNFRPALWASVAEFREFVRPLLGQCDLVKLSDEEVADLLGHSDAERAAEELVSLGVGLACITCGPRGAVLQRGHDRLSVPAAQVEVVDTTGAGDGFVAGLLSRIARRGDVRQIPLPELQAAAGFACEVGSAVCTRLGAVAGLPRLRLRRHRPDHTQYRVLTPSAMLLMDPMRLWAFAIACGAFVGILPAPAWAFSHGDVPNVSSDKRAHEPPKERVKEDEHEGGTYRRPVGAKRSWWNNGGHEDRARVYSSHPKAPGEKSGSAKVQHLAGGATVTDAPSSRRGRHSSGD